MTAKVAGFVQGIDLDECYRRLVEEAGPGNKPGMYGRKRTKERHPEEADPKEDGSKRKAST